MKFKVTAYRMKKETWLVDVEPNPRFSSMQVDGQARVAARDGEGELLSTEDAGNCDFQEWEVEKMEYPYTLTGGEVDVIVYANRLELCLAEGSPHDDYGNLPTRTGLLRLLADYLEAEDLEWVEPEDIGALTDAPILRFKDRIYYFPDYAIRDEVGELLDGKIVEFPSAP